MKQVCQLHATAQICAELQQIMKVYREQEKTEYGVDTPGGLEDMGDVWTLLMRWDRMLTEELKTEEKP